MTGLSNLSDFQFENANEWFKNMDKLIKYVNAKVFRVRFDGYLNVLFVSSKLMEVM